MDRKQSSAALRWSGEADGSLTAVVDYGVVDDKGRAVGGILSIQAPDPTRHADGTHWRVRLYATRDGVQFGAYPPSTFFETKEAALAAAEKKVAQSRKRFIRKFGKPNS